MPVIVVMEDDADIRTLMVHLLTHEGYEVLAADNGSEGLELVESRRPDLIISDVQMPGMTGFQVLDWVRQSPALAATPVILLTALQDRVHVRHGMTAGELARYFNARFQLGCDLHVIPMRGWLRSMWCPIHYS